MTSFPCTQITPPLPDPEAEPVETTDVFGNPMMLVQSPSIPVAMSFCNAECSHMLYQGEYPFFAKGTWNPAFPTLPFVRCEEHRDPAFLIADEPHEMEYRWVPVSYYEEHLPV